MVVIDVIGGILNVVVGVGVVGTITYLIILTREEQKDE